MDTVMRLYNQNGPNDQFSMKIKGGRCKNKVLHIDVLNFISIINHVRSNLQDTRSNPMHLIVLPR